MNLYLGIGIITFPRSVAWVGFTAAVVGLLFLCLISISSSYFLIKARNRFKTTVIVDLGDLGYACYGNKMRVFCKVLLIVTNLSILVAYMIYLGTQVALIVCDFSGRPEDCGTKNGLYSFVATVLMLPIFFVKNF